MTAVNAEARHPATQQVTRWFDYEHLSEGIPKQISARCAVLAQDVVDHLPDGSELTAVLRKLLEAKDCFVRAAVALYDPIEAGDRS